MRSMWMRMRSVEAIEAALSSRSCWSLAWSEVNPRMGAWAKQQAELSRTSRVLNIAQHAVYHHLSRESEQSGSALKEGCSVRSCRAPSCRSSCTPGRLPVLPAGLEGSKWMGRSKEPSLHGHQCRPASFLGLLAHRTFGSATF